MRFLPDSAILGTIRRATRAPKKHKGGNAVSKNIEVLAQVWDSTQDVRSFEETLADAKRHAKEKEKVNQ